MGLISRVSSRTYRITIEKRMALAGHTIFISGASRGIGKAIGLRCARDGANIVVAAKTAEPHPKLPGTIYTAAKERHFHAGAFKGVRDFSTSAPPLVYENVPQVFERIEAICNEEIVGKVGSTFLFDIDGVGKYYLDFKNGAGKVVQAEPDTKPDVTIIMSEQIALKIFNRELKAAAAFMTGQIKARGDLAKAFALEKVLAAARDARLKEQGSPE